MYITSSTFRFISIPFVSTKAKLLWYGSIIKIFFIFLLLYRMAELEKQKRKQNHSPKRMSKNFVEIIKTRKQNAEVIANENRKTKQKKIMTRSRKEPLKKMEKKRIAQKINLLTL